MKKNDSGRKYGVAEWFGEQPANIELQDRKHRLSLKLQDYPDCPFLPGNFKPNTRCKKQGGVCSIREFERGPDGESIGIDSPVSALCPNRFWQGMTVFKAIGKLILGNERFVLEKEVPFLNRVNKLGQIENTQVGNIDLVGIYRQNATVIDWCAIEIQSVYFSGNEMRPELKNISLANKPGAVNFPATHRRPDFRSSGPKRLMPQLQTKVPALRRWGKKMAVIVDAAFFDSFSPMKRIEDISNADIAWFVLDFEPETMELYVRNIVMTTLESAVEGMTAGMPVSKKAFENSIELQLNSKAKKAQDKLIEV